MFTIWPHDHTPRHLSQRNENLIHTKICARMFIAALFVKAERLEVTQLSFTGWMVKHTMVHLYHEILLISKKGINYCYLQKPNGARPLCWLKYPASKDHILCDSIYITFSNNKKGNMRNSVMLWWWSSFVLWLPWWLQCHHICTCDKIA